MAPRSEPWNDCVPWKSIVARYWALVAIVNGWPESQTQSSSEMYDAWEWYGRALRAHA